MSEKVEIYRCSVCGRRIGFIELFSHDHENQYEEIVVYHEVLCEDCRRTADQE